MSLVTANLVRRHRLALTAHQTDQIGRQLVRSKDTAENLVPHVKGLQHHAGPPRRPEAGNRPNRPFPL